MDEVDRLLREVLGDEAPIVKVTNRKAASLEEAERWENEGVVVDPVSVEAVVEKAIREHQDATSATPAEDPPVPAWIRVLPSA